MATNLIIACWSGPRRNEIDELLNIVPYPTTRIGHLQKQVATLINYKHQLAQITLVVPPYSEEPLNFTQYLNNLPESIGKTKLEIYRRPTNSGWSYGSWDAAVQKYQGFDHYIFLEDDYAFIKDDFDTTLIELWNSLESQDIEYMCNFYHLPHAIVTNGITSGAKLEVRNWQLLDTKTEEDGFFDFLKSLNMTGFPNPYHCSLYFGRHVHPGLVVCGQGEYLISPTHAINPHTLVAEVPDSVPYLY